MKEIKALGISRRNIMRLILFGLVVAAGLAAQDNPAGDVIYFRPDAVQTAQVTQAAAGMAAAREAQIQFEYIASEFSAGVVKGAPYSAEAVTESTQTLADGNRIVQKNSAMVFRDSQGRTRREQTLGAIGPLAVQSGEPVRFVTISDPVAGVSYTMDSQTKTAAKIPLRTTISHVGAGGGVAGSWATKETFEVATPGPQPEPGKQMVQTAILRRRADAGGQGNTEQLGKQVIEGIEAEGTRDVMTIPAGQMGNERPMEVVSERWYSPSLQTVVMSKRSDPRMGETVYRLTNINLREPPASLFQVPADYTVKDGSQNVIIKKFEVQK
jgi:hypothetical protein